MKFEYGFDKSSANKTKHGIDFKEIQKLWLGEIVELSAKDKKEPRSMVIRKNGRCLLERNCYEKGQCRKDNFC